MKKIIIYISCILLAAFFVIRIVDAKGGQKTAVKASTEMNCSKCGSGTVCMKNAATSTASKCCEKSCDASKCKEMGCDPAKCKEGKCDPANCKAKSTSASCGMKCKK